MKFKLFLVFLLAGTVGSVSAQGYSLFKKDPCAPVPVSHWSMSLKGGFNYYNMPPDAADPIDRMNLSFGGSLDYTFNPFIGMGIEYLNNDYSRPYTYLGTTGSLTGKTHDILLVGSLNLTNIFTPYRQGFWKYLNFYGDFGGGLALFTADLDGTAATGSPALLGKLGLNAELALGQTFALVLGGDYRQYDALYMTGCKSLRNGDGFTGNLGLRIKFNGKDQKHARNIDLCQYLPKTVPVVVREVNIKQDSEKTLKQIQNIAAENTDLQKKMLKMEEDARLEAQRKALEIQNKAKEKESAMQRRIRELEEKARLDSLRILEQQNAKKMLADKAKEEVARLAEKARQDSIRLAELEQAKKLAAARADSMLQDKFKKMEDDLAQLAAQKAGVVNLVLDNIEFKTGSSVLAASSYVTLDKVAAILQKVTSWNTLKVSGHTDNVGADANNLRLSQLRAQSVKKYLVSQGLDAAKILAVGYGESKPIAPNTTAEGRQKNRRVEFEIK